MHLDAVAIGKGTVADWLLFWYSGSWRVPGSIFLLTTLLTIPLGAVPGQRVNKAVAVVLFKPNGRGISSSESSDLNSVF